MGLLRLREPVWKSNFGQPNSLVDFHIGENKDGFVLPCWDETDNGVPDVCMNSTTCPFHPDNGCTNDNFICHIFGNVGFPYFDKKRKLWMGLAMWSTLFAMFVTAVGALSLSTDKDIVRNTYWVYVEATNSTERTRYFLGLRSIVYIQAIDSQNTPK